MRKDEIKIALKNLKEKSGSHSPSIVTMLRDVEGLKISVDACFLSNPYATDLFMNYLQNEVIKTNKLRSYLEFYPPQNKEIAKTIATAINISPDYIFVGNGAIEIIQAIVHRFCTKKICIIIPTFSAYYEFIMPGIEVIFYKLIKTEDYILNEQDFIDFVQKNQPDTIVIINPNNPNGDYINLKKLKTIIESLAMVENIILDESFIHFAFEDDKYELIKYENWVLEHENLILVKSMSKDFGVAGLRAGYAVMQPRKVAMLLNNGYLWNVSGLADYFFKLYSDKTFLNLYEEIRKQYLDVSKIFYNKLSQISNIKVLPSKANFFLIELLHEQPVFDFCMDLLVDHEVYSRDCSDKIGLEGKYVRIASRTTEENEIITKAITKIIS